MPVNLGVFYHLYRGADASLKIFEIELWTPFTKCQKFVNGVHNFVNGVYKFIEHLPNYGL